MGLRHSNCQRQQVDGQHSSRSLWQFRTETRHYCSALCAGPKRREWRSKLSSVHQPKGCGPRTATSVQRRRRLQTGSHALWCQRSGHSGKYLLPCSNELHDPWTAGLVRARRPTSDGIRCLKASLEYSLVGSCNIYAFGLVDYLYLAYVSSENLHLTRSTSSYVVVLLSHLP